MLYAKSAYESLHRNTILSDTRGKQYLEPVNVALYAKGLSLQMRFWVGRLSPPGGALSVIIFNPQEKKAEEALTTAEGNVTTDAACYGVGFEGGRRGHKPKNAAMEAGKGKETDSRTVHLEGAWPCL